MIEEAVIHIIIILIKEQNGGITKYLRIELLSKRTATIGGRKADSQLYVAQQGSYPEKYDTFGWRVTSRTVKTIHGVSKWA